MTIEEAIMVIKHDLRWKLLKDYPQDVADIAISALEKQIPRKPIRLLYHEVGDCPFCETTVYISEDKFCPSCGQALDWSDTDD